MQQLAFQQEHTQVRGILTDYEQRLRLQEGRMDRAAQVMGETIREVAERALLSAFTISALERGANQTPRSDTLALDPAERTALPPRMSGKSA